MTFTIDYYELLRISRTAPAEMIHAAYRTLMATLRKHPDLGGDPEEAYLINEAYEILSDPSKRARYDAGLKRTPYAAPPRTQGEERRQAPRRDIDAAVSYCLAYDGRWYSARAKDLSTGGVRILAREPLRRGLELVIACPNPASQAVRGQVRWSRMFHPSLFERVYEAGVEFETPIPDIDKRFSL